MDGRAGRSAPGVRCVGHHPRPKRALATGRATGGFRGERIMREACEGLAGEPSPSVIPIENHRQWALLCSSLNKIIGLPASWRSTHSHDVRPSSTYPSTCCEGSRTSSEALARLDRRNGSQSRTNDRN